MSVTKYGLRDFEVVKKIDPANLPSKILFLFDRKYKGSVRNHKRTCFMGDNGLAYDMQNYSVFLGMKPQAIIHRIHVEPEGSDYLRERGKPGPPPGTQVKVNPGTEEWQAMGSKPRDHNLNKIGPFGRFDSLVKSRPVKDPNVSISEILGNQAAGNSGPSA